MTQPSQTLHLSSRNDCNFGLEVQLSPQGKLLREAHLEAKILRDIHQLQSQWDGKPFEAIIFEGGGTKGMVYAGAIHRLQEAGLFDDIKCFGGTSAGAQTAALCAVGYTGSELKVLMTHTPWDKLLDKSSLLGCFGCFPNVYRLVTKHGWCKGEVLQNHLEMLISAKMGPGCTLKRLYEEKGVVLRVGACNVTTRRFELLDYTTYPDMPVSVAARASSNIPFVFVPVEYENSVAHPGQRCLYVDGGLEGNIPMKAFPGKRSLAFDLMSSGDWSRKHGNPIRPKGLWHFSATLLDMVLNSAQSGQGFNEDDPRISAGLRVQIVKIHCGDHGVLETNLSEQEVLLMVAAGWDAVDEFLETAAAAGPFSSSTSVGTEGTRHLLL